MDNNISKAEFLRNCFKEMLDDGNRREHDGLIGFLRTFIQSSEEAHGMYRQMKLPEITERMIDECIDEIPIKADREYIRSFILSGQGKVREIIFADIEPSEDNTIGIML